MDPLKRDFLGSYLTRFFGVCNFGNTWAMTVIFFVENVQNLNKISKMQKKIRNKIFDFEINASELVALYCLY